MYSLARLNFDSRHHYQVSGAKLKKRGSLRPGVEMLKKIVQIGERFFSFDNGTETEVK